MYVYYTCQYYIDTANNYKNNYTCMYYIVMNRYGPNRMRGWGYLHKLYEWLILKS